MLAIVGIHLIETPSAAPRPHPLVGAAEGVVSILNKQDRAGHPPKSVGVEYRSKYIPERLAESDGLYLPDRCGRAPHGAGGIRAGGTCGSCGCSRAVLSQALYRVGDVGVRQRRSADLRSAHGARETRGRCVSKVATPPYRWALKAVVVERF